MANQLGDARRVAADLLDRMDRPQDAAIVRAGGGDDFVEVRAALAALSTVATRLRHWEQALRCYADTSFWEGDGHNACLALHDAGDMARAALAGRALFHHRD